MTAKRSGSYGKPAITKSVAWQKCSAFHGLKYGLKRQTKVERELEKSGKGKSGDTINHIPENSYILTINGCRLLKAKIKRCRENICLLPLMIIPGSFMPGFSPTRPSTVPNSFYARLQMNVPIPSNIPARITAKNSKGQASMPLAKHVRIWWPEIHPHQAAANQRQGRTGHSHTDGNVA